MSKKLFIYLLLILLLTSCGTNESEEKVISVEEINEEVFYKDWAKKSGQYGDFYTDYEDMLLITDIDGEDFEYNLLESLAFYRPDIFSNSDLIEKNHISENEFFININSKIKIKSIKKGNKLYSIVSNDEDRLNEFYKELL